MKFITRGKQPEVYLAVFLALVVGGIVGYLSGANRLHFSQHVPMQAVLDESTQSPHDGITVGGDRLQATQSVTDNTAGARNLTNIMAVLRASGVADTLASSGPYTLFAPTNDAFSMLGDGGLATLLNPNQKDRLNLVAQYVVVPGSITSAELRLMASKGEKLTSINNRTITPVFQGEQLFLQDTSGAKATIENADIVSSNGIIHTVTTVMQP